MKMEKFFICEPDDISKYYRGAHLNPLVYEINDFEELTTFSGTNWQINSGDVGIFVEWPAPPFNKQQIIKRLVKEYKITHISWELTKEEFLENPKYPLAIFIKGDKNLLCLPTTDIFRILKIV